MDIKVVRYMFSSDWTQSHMFINDVYICDVIEPFDSGIYNSDSKDTILSIKKKYGKIAIGYGIYPITLQYSSHFKRILPYLNNVNGFVGIMQHNGNDVSASRGCQILGVVSNKDGYVVNSKNTVDDVVKRYSDAIESGDEIFLTVVKSKNAIER